jgi:nucleotide-binding universal stress UspA family protein
MSSTAWLAAAMAGWIGIGAIEAMVLGRRGFDGFSWFLIGVVLGPLSVLLAWNSARRDEHLAPSVVATSAARRAAGVDVLIGFDGSPECRATADAVLSALDGRLGRVALVSVTHFDEAPAREEQLRAALGDEGARLANAAPDLVLVSGHPATALAQAAVVGGYDLIAIGSTGKGHAHLFGSAAKELVRTSPVPVILGGQRARVGSDPGSLR